MTSSEGLHLKTYIFLLIMVTFGPLGDVFLGKGMKTVGAAGSRAPARCFHFFARAFTSGTVWLGNWIAARVFHRLHFGAFLGGFQFRAAGFFDFLCDRGAARPFFSA